MQVWSLAREDPLEEGMATHSSILARWAPLHGVAKSRTQLKWLSMHAHMQSCGRAHFFTTPLLSCSLSASWYCVYHCQAAVGILADLGEAEGGSQSLSGFQAPGGNEKMPKQGFLTRGVFWVFMFHTFTVVSIYLKNAKMQHLHSNRLRDKPSTEIPPKDAPKLWCPWHPPQNLPQRSSVGVRSWKDGGAYLRAMGDDPTIAAAEQSSARLVCGKDEQ